MKVEGEEEMRAGLTKACSGASPRVWPGSQLSRGFGAVGGSAADWAGRRGIVPCAAPLGTVRPDYAESFGQIPVWVER
jgi:hypothetical protein